MKSEKHLIRHPAIFAMATVANFFQKDSDYYGRYRKMLRDILDTILNETGDGQFFYRQIIAVELAADGKGVVVHWVPANEFVAVNNIVRHYRDPMSKTCPFMEKKILACMFNLHIGPCIGEATADHSLWSYMTDEENRNYKVHEQWGEVTISDLIKRKLVHRHARNAYNNFLKQGSAA